ncbi:MAG: UDP-N-acetylmuramoyl-tripeptide--D-alanyl-D-alanine ligase [Nitrospiraceae bacterium]|nr:UDP-N-acetylmuramoyl-tripeptide--D-alanyl-D-alanine ligase [Nitrospiraceae bacterium]
MLTAEFIKTAANADICTSSAVIFSGVSIDSRTAVEGDLFVALAGDKFDGHDFVASALIKASGAVVNKEHADKLCSSVSGKTIFAVDDTLKALQDMANARRKAFSGPVVAVAGSNGKTTTKEITASVLSEKFRVHKTSGNFNNHIGMPLTITRMEDSTEALVLEMGTNRPGDINELCSIALPDTAVITNIGYEHIEGFGSLHKVRESELEIMPFVKTVIYNADDAFLVEGVLSRQCDRRISFGIDAPDADVKASDIEYGQDGMRFVLSYADQNCTVSTSLPGLFNVYNLLAGAAAGISAGMLLEEIKAGLEKFSGVPMRCRVISLGSATFIDDVYNANPSSMAESLKELSRRAGSCSGQKSRAIAVLGDMLELGYYGIEAHKNIGRLMTELGIDIFIGVGPLMELAAAEFAGKSITADTPEQAAAALRKELIPGDTVLLKGSRGMKMEMVLESPIMKEEANNAV